MIFKCCICKNKFERNPSQVRNKERPCCSRICYAKRMSIENTGANNYNYKHGKCIKKSQCKCGRFKDCRAKQCSICANVGIPKFKYRDKAIKEKEQAIIECAQYADSYIEISKITGVSRQTVKRMLDRLKIDTSSLTRTKNRFISDSKVFIKRKVGGRRPLLRKVVLRNQLIEYKCAICQLQPKWCKQSLTLELDHINGNPLDDRLKNLRFLCPNCHSQTPTRYKRKRKLK